MSDCFEPVKNCFELFGFDFVVDEQLKCWLIEANMSPACARRDGQEWLASLLEDMSDGMVNLIEEKVVRNMQATGHVLTGKLADKAASIRNGVDLKGWRKVSLQGELRRVPDDHGISPESIVASSKTPCKPRSKSKLLRQKNHKSAGGKLEDYMRSIKGGN